jgi:hypothetical protein
MPQDGFPHRSRTSRSALRWRMRRGCCNAKRLEYEASVLASVYGAVRLGRDEELRSLLARRGLGEDAVSALRFREADTEYGVILPTDRTWNLPRLQCLTFDVGFDMSTEGHRILVIPPADLRLQPRLANAQHVFHAKKAPARGDLDVLIRWIETHGGEATLGACVAALDSPGARERVFGLVFGGHLALDLASAITDLSIVRLGARFRTSSWDRLGWRILRTDRALACTSPDAAAMEIRSA